MSEIPPETKVARRIVLAAVLGVGLFVLLLAGAGFAGSWPRVPQLAAAVDLPSDEQTNPAAKLLIEMNAALEAGDREGFLAAADGQGEEALALWFDNMAELGATRTAIWSEFGLYGSDDDEYGVDDRPQEITLGAAMPFAESSEAGSGWPRAGQTVLQGAPYSALVTVDGGVARITGLEPAGNPNPWDEGPLYVVTNPHSVTYGLEEEQAIVDANAATVEQSAVEALEIAASRSDVELPLKGFMAAITDDQERYGQWRGIAEDEGHAQSGGFARVTQLPSHLSDGIADDIAVGTDYSTSYVAMGPISAPARADAVRHEFIHVIQNTWDPQPKLIDQAGVDEGFARYFGEYVPAGAPEAGPVYTRLNRESLDTLGSDLSAEDVYGSTGGYELAASRFQYLEELGGDAWAAGMESRTTGLLFLTDAALEVGATEQGWMDWIRNG